MCSIWSTITGISREISRRVAASSAISRQSQKICTDAADAVVLAVKARRSTTRDLRKAIDQIGASKVVGTVLVR